MLGMGFTATNSAEHGSALRLKNPGFCPGFLYWSLLRGSSRSYAVLSLIVVLGPLPLTLVMPASRPACEAYSWLLPITW